MRGSSMRRLGWIAVCAVLAGCPKGKEEVADAGPKAWGTGTKDAVIPGA